MTQSHVPTFFERWFDRMVTRRGLTGGSASDALKSYLANTVTYNNVDAVANTALSVTVEAGGIYDIDLVVHSTNTVVSLRLDFGGTATFTNFRGQWFAWGIDGLAWSATDTSDPGLDMETAAIDAINNYWRFRGTMEVDAGGTFVLRGAQRTADLSNTTILRGSTLIVTRLN